MFALITVRGIAARVAPAWSVLAQATRGVVIAAVNRRAVRELDQSDDRLLKDIGLTRGDLSAALDVPFYRDPSANLAAHSGGRVFDGAARTGSAYLRRDAAPLNRSRSIRT